MPAPEQDFNLVPGQTVDAAWERLEAQFELSGGFWLGFVFSAAPQAVDALRKKRNTLFEANGLRWRDYQPSDPDALAKSLIWLLTSPEPLDVDCVWVEAIRADSSGASEQPWTRAWEQLFLRTNEHRDALRARLRGGLVFAAPSVIMPLVREAAPDLWSVRSIVVNVELEPLTGAPHPMPSLFPADMEATGQFDSWALKQAVVAAPVPRLAHASRESRAYSPRRPGPSGPAAMKPTDLGRPVMPEASVIPPIPPPKRAPLPTSSASTQPHGTRQLLTPIDRGIVEAWIDGGNLGPARSRINQALAELGSEDLIEKAFAHHMLARLHQANGDVKTAAQCIGEAIAIHARITPDLVPIDWYEMARGLAWKNGDVAAATVHSLSAIAQCRRRIRAKEGIDTLRDLAVALRNYGEHERNQKDMAAAIDAFDEGVIVARRLVDLSNEDASDLVRLSDSLLSLGDARAQRLDFVGALATFEEAVKINRKICVLVGDTIIALRALSVSLNRLGHLRHETGDTNGAARAFEEALAIRRRIFNEDDPQSVRDLISVLSRIGLLRLALNDYEAAANALREGNSLGRELRRLLPESTTASYQLAFVLCHLGKAQEHLGKYAEAKIWLNEAVHLARELLKLSAESANARLLLEHAEKALASIKTS